jgi:hypothetical protein
MFDDVPDWFRNLVCRYLRYAVVSLLVVAGRNGHHDWMSCQLSIQTVV